MQSFIKCLSLLSALFFSVAHAQVNTGGNPLGTQIAASGPLRAYVGDVQTCTVLMGAMMRGPSVADYTPANVQGIFDQVKAYLLAKCPNVVAIRLPGFVLASGGRGEDLVYVTEARREAGWKLVPEKVRPKAETWPDGWRDYLAGFPTAAAVASSMSPATTIDEAARQSATWQILQNLLGRLTRWPANGEPQHLLDAYRQAQSQGLETFSKTAVVKGRPFSGIEARSNADALGSSYRCNASFQQQTLERFFSKDWRDRLASYDRSEEGAKLIRQRAITANECDEIDKRPAIAGLWLRAQIWFNEHIEFVSGTGKWIAVGLLSLMIVIGLRPMSIQQGDVMVVRHGGRSFSLIPISGTVMDLQRWSETRVHATPGTHNVPGTISSTTTLNEKLYLRDLAGHEHEWSMQNVELSARAGHEITGVIARRSRRKSGSLVLIKNRSLGRTTTLAALKRVVRPTLGIGVALILMGVALMYFDLLQDRHGTPAVERSASWLMMSGVIYWIVVRPLIGAMRQRKLLERLEATT